MGRRAEACCASAAARYGRSAAGCGEDLVGAIEPDWKLMDSYTGAGVIGLAMGGLALVYGVLLRTGTVHADVARQYRNEALPRYQRNGVFALIPFGLMFLIAGALLVVHDTAALWLALVTIVVWVVGFVFGIVVPARPPWWMKPRWLRVAEADGWRHYTRPPFRVTQAVLVTSIVLVFGCAFVLMLVQGTATEVAGALITGAGVLVLLLLRRRGST
jgi:hypothetical protein